MITSTGQHAFAGNPLLLEKRDVLSTPDLCEAESAGALRVLPLLDGKPLVTCIASSQGGGGPPAWRLAWQSFGTCHTALLASHQALDAFLAEQSAPAEERPELSHGILNHDTLMYLGDRKEVTYCALDVSMPVVGGGSAPAVTVTAPEKVAPDSLWLQSLVKALEAPTSDGKIAFLDLRLLMTGTDWADQATMEELSIAGHARALWDWHSHSRFCGRCGTATVSKEGGKRRQCMSDLCKRKLYPRIDPVVIMLIIDKERDCALLGRQSRFVPRMWSCLAGFIEPGESFEEAVRRETMEEVGIEVGDVVYHSSQPWPVGPSSMPCQLMVGFFAIATTFDISIDKKELEEAQWHSREQVRKALNFNEYKNQQQVSASKIHQTCSGEERKKGSSTDLRVDIGEIAPMFVPGPYAIAHHLISFWAVHGPDALPSNV